MVVEKAKEQKCGFSGGWGQKNFMNVVVVMEEGKQLNCEGVDGDFSKTWGGEK